MQEGTPLNLIPENILRDLKSAKSEDRLAAIKGLEEVDPLLSTTILVDVANAERRIKFRRLSFGRRSNLKEQLTAITVLSKSGSESARDYILATAQSKVVEVEETRRDSSWIGDTPIEMFGGNPNYYGVDYTVTVKKTVYPNAYGEFRLALEGSYDSDKNKMAREVLSEAVERVTESDRT